MAVFRAWLQSAFLHALEKYPDEQAKLDVQTEEMFKNRTRCYTCNRLGHISVQCGTRKRGVARKYAKRWLHIVRDRIANSGLGEQQDTASSLAGSGEGWGESFAGG